MTTSQKIIILNDDILWYNIFTFCLIDTTVLLNTEGKFLCYIGIMYTSDMVHFFHEMLVYNPTCFGFTATLGDNTIIVGRFSRPLHIVPNIKSKRAKYKDIDVIRGYKYLKYLFKLSNKILKCKHMFYILLFY